MAFDVGFVQELVRGFRELFREISQYLNAYYAINGTVIILEFLLICFVGCCVMCLQFYASLAIGHSFPNHKMAWSVLWFFALQFATQLLAGSLFALLDESWLHHLLMAWTDSWNLSGTAATQLMMLIVLLGEVLYGAVYYFLTTWSLKKRLNLE